MKFFDIFKVFMDTDVMGDRPVAPTVPTGPKPKSIGAVMAGFKSTVTKRINELRRTPGTRLWQRNYWEHIIRNKPELNHIREYIHNNPAQLMAYIGLVPSEHSSGPTVKRGPITKTGNSHARRTLIESAQAYRLPARKSAIIRKRQEGLPEDVREIAWKAQLRLCHRYRRLTAKGKNHNVVITAIARELAGFIWAINQAITISVRAQSS